ncbi:hypothetical protein [Thiomicrorhabdus indica]|uniref:hypothetical protein n=1 Tax=Thiomicrorhabdus indica TaxID=2267253 RepID=UPI002AA8C2E5|nr:hypothetical protein [Thiomicrorhabdus indica]
MNQSTLKRITLVSVLLGVAILNGCSKPYEQRPIPWAKAKVYEAVEMSGVVNRTYIRKPDYYSTCMMPTHFQTCHNYYLTDMRCAKPVKAVPTCQARVSGCR